jgi:tetratricopeptide (TPR) repeat protein
MWMSKRLPVIASVILSLALVISGCTGAKPAAPSAPVANKKPALTVPSHFDSTSDEKAFAVKAVDQGYYAEAKPLLEHVVATAPDGEAYSQLGTARYNVKDFEGAIEAWTKAAELTPSMLGEMQNNIGNALRDSKKLPEAEAAYRKALEVEPTRWTAAVNLATMLKGENKADEAVAVQEKAVAANKDVPSLPRLLASMKSNPATN